ncbi:MAG: beta-galactosidase trimerization domain-containing protein [Acidobacteria bacterium]|nr:beta-galactosidase trimerization domain-containing protein [Acidobacteriota bacterium]
MPSRRDFLEGVTSVAASCALGRPGGFASARRQTEIEATAWFDRPMRWAQLTLVENDPGRFDLKEWLDYFRRVHADAACLSAGGCVAYYPTRIPLHHRSEWLKDTDPFGDLVAGCRKLGMVVVARTDPHAVHQDVFDAHPEWIAVDAEGRKRRRWASPEMWVTCALGPYNFEFMTEVTREIVTLYKVDGIFSNRWSGSGMCYCDHCRKSFRDHCGLELPRRGDPRDPARRYYILWREQRLFDLWRLWDSEIRKINPAARFIPNSGGGALSDLDMRTAGEMADIMIADRQARRGMAAPWANGKNAKEFRAAIGRKPAVGIFSVGLEEPYRWKDSVQSGAEIRIWATEGIANGMRPWFTKFSGVLYDRRWLKVVEDLYGWLNRNEAYLRNEESLARVALVYSQQTARFYGGERAAQKVEDHTLGFYHALVESRIPFDMVHDRLLDAEHVGRYKTLLLPNIAALSDGQCAQIRDFVSRGGSLVATYETSLYDEWGARRSDFGLGDLFGARFTGRSEGRMQNSYLNVEKDPSTGAYHPLLAGLEDAGRIINGVQRVDAVALERSIPPPLTLIPSYPDLPMEKVYPRQPKTDIPGVFLREVGKGRVVYFPWDIDRTFWEVLCVDREKLLRNAVDWATHEERPVTVTGPGVVDVTVWRQKSSMTVHLVNLTNPMMMKGPFREFYPIGEQRVRLRLPGGRKASKVELLVSGQDPRASVSGGYLEAAIPSILVHELLAVNW